MADRSIDAGRGADPELSGEVEPDDGVANGSGDSAWVEDMPDVAGAG